MPNHPASGKASSGFYTEPFSNTVPENKNFPPCWTPWWRDSTDCPKVILLIKHRSRASTQISQDSRDLLPAIKDLRNALRLPSPQSLCPPLISYHMVEIWGWWGLRYSLNETPVKMQLCYQQWVIHSVHGFQTWSLVPMRHDNGGNEGGTYSPIS